MLLTLVLLVALVGGGLYVGKSFGLFSVAPSGQSGTGVPSSACPNSNGVGTLNYAARNPANSSLFYPAVSYVAIYTAPDNLAGSVAGSGTASELKTQTFDRDITTIECLSKIKVITLGGTVTSINNTGRVDDVMSAVGTNAYLLVDAPASGAPIKMFIRDNSYTNQTTTMDGVVVATTGGFVTASVSTAMGTGSETDWVVDMLPTAGYVYGNYQRNELVLLLDGADSTKFSTTSGLTITGVPGLVSIPATTYGINSGKSSDVVAYKMPAVSGSLIAGFPGLTGTQRLSVRLLADVGNPTASVILYVYQPGWFQDIDGSYKYGVFNSAGTQAIGGTNTVTFTVT